MRKFVIAAAVVVASGVGFGIANAGDGGGPLGVGDKPEMQREFEPVRFEPDRALARAEASKKKKKPKIIYLSTNELPVEANGTQSVTGQCPNGAKAIDGGYATDGGIVADFLAPLPPDMYAYSVIDLTGLPGTVVFTLTCSKNNG